MPQAAHPVTVPPTPLGSADCGDISVSRTRMVKVTASVYHAKHFHAFPTLTGHWYKVAACIIPYYR